MGNEQKPKRRYYHVWQLYLRSWAKSGAIWRLQDGRIFSTDTTRIAVEKDFYKFRRLTETDEQVMKPMFARSDPSAQSSSSTLIDRLMSPFRLVEAHPDALANESVESHLDDYASDVLEELDSAVEARFIRLLKLALGGDVSFYDDDRCITFLDYLTKQHMRTKGIKGRVKATVKPVGEFDIGRDWNILSFMLAQNLGTSLYGERKKRELVVLKNTSNIPFVTGDQPVVNLQAKGAETSAITIFYPLSPILALWLGEIDEVCPYSSGGITGEDVGLLNDKIIKSSCKQIFASDHGALEIIAGSV
jgi:hypothetical protein